LYAFTSFAIILGCSIFVFTRVHGDDTDRREYYNQYIIIIGMYFPGVLYFLIFFAEKNYIKVQKSNKLLFLFDCERNASKQVCDNLFDHASSPPLTYVHVMSCICDVLSFNAMQGIEEDFDEMNLFAKEFYDDEDGEGEGGSSDGSSFRLSCSIKSSLGGTDGPQSSLRSVLLEGN
jgi:hypothetical protein